ncbi:polysaccharide deacetylase family protein [Afifella pfennigii]|uniref:polysaccharide deacetylase family protein n=1 Tax=Afifella pfennigii TaxID=209897 RepID=UPI00047BC27D|nr:polysaccharide deacetylase family protein [Afifella pfennigii]
MGRTMIAALLQRFGFRPSPEDSGVPAGRQNAEPEAENVAQMRGYAELCRAAGVDRLYLLLTFDCDTDEDIAAAEALETDLRRRGIRSGYAVPGVQLENGAATWRRLAESGAEFLNHGYRPHAEWRDGRYQSATFYADMERDEVAGDIAAGHEAVIAATGVVPEGFRAPHFGCFQAPEQLQFLYGQLKPLGYRYASTTIPAMALSRGPVVDMDEFVELPTMGSYRYPPTILDSWTYLTDRTNYALGEIYWELFSETVERMLAEEMPGILTYYCDPSHVAGQAAFEKAIDLVAKRNLPSLQGREAVRRFRAL